MNEPIQLPEETGALIDFIEARFHAVHRRELPDLLALARLVEAAQPGAPRGLADLLQRMAWELEAHMQKEEEGLFPAMRDGTGASAAAIELMRDEHDAHADHLRRLAAMTGDFTAPAGADAAWRALYAGARKLADDLAAHIRAENEVLFPRFAD